MKPNSAAVRSGYACLAVVLACAAVFSCTEDGAESAESGTAAVPYEAVPAQANVPGFDGGRRDTGMNANRLAPVRIGPSEMANGWAFVSAGQRHTAAIGKDGSLWAWGMLALDDGLVKIRNRPVRIGSQMDWVYASSGGFHTLLLKADGSLWAWGGNNWGVLGDGMGEGGWYSNRLEGMQYVPVQIGAGRSWASVSAGSNHSAAVAADGSLWTWGCNSYGQLGDGGDGNDGLWPMFNNTMERVGTDSDWASVCAGGNFTVAIKTDGSLWVWGTNYWGQLGNGAGGEGEGHGNRYGKNKPVRIGSENDWAVAVTGGNHTVALQTDGSLWAWGYNAYGQLGNGEGGGGYEKRYEGGHNIPERVGTGNDWTAVSAGWSNTVALRADGSLWAWGLISNNGEVVRQTTPVRIGTSQWTAASSGYSHTAIIGTDGSLWTWGGNRWGQLGDGTDGGGRPY